MRPDHERMVSCYVSVAQRSWRDESYKRRLATEPREALAEEGWILPERTEIRVRFLEEGELTGHPSIEEVVELWQRGIDEGELRLAIFDREPDLETRGLSEDELDSVTGGTTTAAGLVIPV